MVSECVPSHVYVFIIFDVTDLTPTFLVSMIIVRETWTNLIFGVLVYHIEYKKPIVFGRGQRSFGFNTGQIGKML